MFRMFIALGVIMAVIAPALILSPASAASGPNYNDPAYWETQFEHPAVCYKHEVGETTSHGVDNGDGSVTLNPWDPSWPGDHPEALIVKSGSVDSGDGPGNAVYHHPIPGVPYFGPLNAAGEQGAVSHWIFCKGTTPDTTTTTLPPTTTTLPPVTTTTTLPPVTTTLPPVTTTTTLPPVTTTTLPPTTTTLPPQPPFIGITLEVACDNTDSATGKIEQIRSWWDGTYTVGSTDEFDVFIELESPIGTSHPAIWPSMLPTLGYHDNGPGYEMTDWVRAEAWVAAYDSDGVLGEYFMVASSEVYCGTPVETTLPPETTTTTLAPSCDEDHALWNEENQNCDPLPFTGLSTTEIVLYGLLILDLGALAVAYSARKRGWGWRTAFGIATV